jgi:hypothetical protein
MLDPLNLDHAQTRLAAKLFAAALSVTSALACGDEGCAFELQGRRFDAQVKCWRPAEVAACMPRPRSQCSDGGGETYATAPDGAVWRFPSTCTPAEQGVDGWHSVTRNGTDAAERQSCGDPSTDGGEAQ